MIEFIVIALVVSGVGIMAVRNALDDSMTEGMAQAGAARAGECLPPTKRK